MLASVGHHGQMASNPSAALPVTAHVRVVLGPWADGSGPLYRQLADSLRAAVMAGTIRDALPSERDLAGALGVSRTTAVAAYELLAGEGIIERRRGSGTYLVRRPILPDTCPDPLDCIDDFFG